MSEPTPRDSRRKRPSRPKAGDAGSRAPRFAAHRPKTVYSDSVPAASPTRAPGGSGRPRPHDDPADINRRFRISLGLTAASTVIPGSGMLGAPLLRTKVIGAVLGASFLGVALLLLFQVVPNWQSYAGIVTDKVSLSLLIVLAIAIGVLWVATITITNLVTRPHGLRTAQRVIAALVVAVLASTVAIPSALAARYSFDTMKALRVFNKADDVTATSRPTIDATADDPWTSHPRLNILLLGSDNDQGRDYNSTGLGIRTDTIIVASIDTGTGASTLIQIPRNLPYAPFPEGSVLADEFPYGFMGDMSRDESHINALWLWSEENRDLFGGATFPGAEGLKLGVEGVTGLDIDYFVMIDIDGLRQLVDAMGGVTVNINQRLDIGGDTEGRRPTGSLEPGPNQHLDGYHALWYARSRRNTDDYNRMARQSCLIGAIVDQANPVTMLTRFEAIAAAGSDMVLTDIPSEMLRPIVDLALKVKDQPMSRLAFSNGNNGYHYEDPDFDAMREAVDLAINPPPPTSTPTADPTTSSSPAPSTSPGAGLIDGAQDVSDACAYHPVEE
ncbi:MAG TPA: LCP family protein [Arachnia sp.]|nr:LCP family protein [Arachnia sp.]HMT87569.1 LCP family protein [Arachnia sp.]